MLEGTTSALATPGVSTGFGRPALDVRGVGAGLVEAAVGLGELGLGVSIEVASGWSAGSDEIQRPSAAVIAIETTTATTRRPPCAARPDDLMPGG
jgi:hypothetical protein